MDSPEAARLLELHALDILDTPPEAIFDRLTALAALAFEVPVALVSLVDADRQWFKSCHGLGLRQTGREVAFCDYAIRRPEVLVVPDARFDIRFCANPLVTGEPGIRFYAGAPLNMPGGARIGTLCLIDFAPRSGLSRREAVELEAMARVVVEALLIRRELVGSRGARAA